jgi:hypothetical protein
VNSSREYAPIIVDALARIGCPKNLRGDPQRTGCSWARRA